MKNLVKIDFRVPKNLTKIGTLSFGAALPSFGTKKLLDLSRFHEILAYLSRIKVAPPANPRPRTKWQISLFDLFFSRHTKFQ